MEGESKLYSLLPAIFPKVSSPSFPQDGIAFQDALGVKKLSDHLFFSSNEILNKENEFNCYQLKGLHTNTLIQDETPSILSQLKHLTTKIEVSPVFFTIHLY